MYSEADLTEINARIRKNLIVLVPILLVILAVYIFALSRSIEWLTMAAGPVLFVAAAYGLLAYLLPNIRYKGFLCDMQEGLTRTMEGTVVSVAEQAEYQDGAWVLPVHLLLTEEQDERIVYLNRSKRALFPPEGTGVALSCYGRHIRAVEKEWQVQP